jgi:hypothetical protein
VIILRAVNCSKGWAGIFFARKSKKNLPVPPLAALLSNSQHSANPAVQGRDEERAFRSEQGTGGREERAGRLIN